MFTTVGRDCFSPYMLFLNHQGKGIILLLPSRLIGYGSGFERPATVGFFGCPSGPVWRISSPRFRCRPLPGFIVLAAVFEGSTASESRIFET